MRITIVIPTLNIGGAERMAVHWANHWTAMGRAVTIVTLDFEGGTSCFALDERVRVVDADRRDWWRRPHPEVFENLMANCTPAGADDVRNELPLLLRIRHAVLSTEPDAVVGFPHLASTRTAAALWRSGIPMFATEHCDPRSVVPTEFIAGSRDVLRLGAATVVALTHADLDFLIEEGTAQGEVIFNPAMPAPVRCTTKTSRTIIGLGRLEPVKGFDILIDAFSRVAAVNPSWHLRICGDGRARAALRELVSRSGAPIELAGATFDPYGELAGAAIFVLPSRHESFPVALLEAMACGLPVVASACSAGVREIVRPGVDGMLVAPESAAALAEALDRLMRDDAERARLGARTPEVIERFSLDEASARWDALFEPVTQAAAGAVSV
jgi:GalNAc-alpha-(1->4)-GalNAc-alpha-(1->3)-diNAcBac-PP-undecaprenol alpha-1,4-N-acetyl-D-galactosaminyltransferase